MQDPVQLLSRKGTLTVSAIHVCVTKHGCCECWHNEGSISIWVHVGGRKKQELIRTCIDHVSWQLKHDSLLQVFVWASDCVVVWLGRPGVIVVIITVVVLVVVDQTPSEGC